jgi:thiamine-monophosphate kinase
MSDTVADIGEFGLIDRIDALLESEGCRVPERVTGIGDDCAVFAPRPGYDILVTCDVMMEGRHYLPRFMTPSELGRRAMTLNISDIGAMGGGPRYALISLGMRSDTPVRDIEGIYRGFIEDLRPFNAVIVGGNITKSDGANFIDITLIGEIASGTSVRRSTARPGDAVLVTGYPGEAAAGLEILLSDPSGDQWKNHPLVQAYLRPSHRAMEGAAAAHSGLATAMIDTSDGLLGDLGHICNESGVGIRLFQEDLPVSPPLQEAARRINRDPLEFVLGQSDDYELIITCSPDHVRDLCAAVTAVASVPVRVIGQITPPPDDPEAILLTSTTGPARKLDRAGWDHFSK